jgi:large subunit ribosomal protein L6
MSRIGKQPVKIPPGVSIELQGRLCRVRGPKGELSAELPQAVRVKIEDGICRVERDREDRVARSMHGLAQRLIANMVEGVSGGFKKSLEIVGVGYRAELRNPRQLFLTLGYSHPIVFQLPDGVSATVERQTLVTLEGADKQRVGEVAAMIRRLRPPEPYKGKGVRYVGEVLRRKAGKAAGGGG